MSRSTRGDVYQAILKIKVNNKYYPFFSVYWKHFVSINVDDIVYVHCHQAGGQDTGGTIILVEQDGIQRPPIHFPEGGHMSAFLSCLETGAGRLNNS